MAAPTASPSSGLPFRDKVGDARRLRMMLLIVALFAVAPVPAASAAGPLMVNNGLIVAGDHQIRAMDSDGNSIHTLFSGFQIDAARSPAWSPDGAWLAFDHDADIAVMDFRGQGLRRLTTTETVWEREPAWSPDGSRIAFVRDGHIWVMNADGSDQQQITSMCCNGAPAWAPDGTTLAFDSDRSGTSQIYALDAEVGEPAAQLTESEGYNRWPDWSPDGTSIAFTSTRREGIADVWTMNADGSGEVELTSRPSEAKYPAWSPDGHQIVYSEGHFVRMVGRDGTADHFVGNLGLEPDWQPLPACTITGTDEADGLVGTPGDDVICGMGGGDAIRGGPGDDILIGGPGDDTVVFDQVFSGVEVDLQSAAALGEGHDLVLLVENARGSHGDDVLKGNEEANFLRSDDGDDFVHGGEGADRMEGGAGIDTVAFSGNGTTTVDLSMGIARQDLTLDDLSMFENVVGSVGNDHLIGDAGPNVLDGGPDRAARFEGGGGDDTMIGGQVDYSRARNGVHVDLVTGKASGEGNDTLIDIGSVVGSYHDDWLRGPASPTVNAHLFGLGGDDVITPTSPDAGLLSGGAGEDTLLVADLAIPVDLDLRDFLTPRGRGSIPIPSFENAIGTRYADAITGTAGSNELSGRGGADDVVGGRGRDFLSGGLAGDGLHGGAGIDSIAARDATVDRVDGGTQADRCVVDRKDLVRRCP
jgi:Ca2+-binding RTX toxin-like protein